MKKEKMNIMDLAQMKQANTVLIKSDALNSLPMDIREAIFRFSHRIKIEFQDKIIQIILFGSYARGDYHLDSDVDLLIITTDDSWSVKKRIMSVGFDLYPDIGVIVSPKVMT